MSEILCLKRKYSLKKNVVVKLGLLIDQGTNLGKERDQFFPFCTLYSLSKCYVFEKHQHTQLNENSSDFALIFQRALDLALII